MDLKVGIVGCGGIARSHVASYQKKGLKISAVTDTSPEAAKKLAQETGATIFKDFRDLLDNGKVDLISICTPPVVHEETTCYALGKGIHVLCEKPMAFDIPSAHRIQEAVNQSKAIFMPAFRHRFFPANITMREIIVSGKIGNVVLFNNIFCGPAFDMEKRWFTKKCIAGGGSLLDTNSHSVDLFRFLVGEVASQHAVMHRHFTTTDVEDAGILSVKAVNGAIGAMESAFVAGCGAAFIDIMGTKGRIYFDYFEPTKVKYRLTEDKEWTELSAPAGCCGFDEEIHHFIGAIKGEHPLSCTVHDGVRCTEIICSIYPI
jgi:predicted dehydrogenase